MAMKRKQSGLSLVGFLVVLAVVSFGAPQAPAGRERREWSAGLRQAVDELRSVR